LDTAERMKAIRIEAIGTKLPVAVVIEVDPACAEVANSMLRMLGFHVIPVTRGAEALHTIDEGPIDLIVLDAQLNDMETFEFITVARKLPGFADTKIIVASAIHSATSTVGQTLLKLGISSYFDKPYTLARMRHRIRELFPGLGESQKLLSHETEALALPGAVGIGDIKKPIRLIAASDRRLVVRGERLPLGEVVHIYVKHRQEQFGEIVTIDLVGLGQVVSTTSVGVSPTSELAMHFARPPLEWDKMTEELPEP